MLLKIVNGWLSPTGCIQPGRRSGACGLEQFDEVASRVGEPRFLLRVASIVGLASVTFALSFRAYRFLGDG